MRFPSTILVNPPNPPGYVSNKDSMGGYGQLYPRGAPPFPPLDIPYLGAFLTSRGIGVQVVEAGAHDLSPEAAVDAVRRAAAADALVLVRTSLPTVDWDLEFCARLRREGRFSAVALFGPVIPSLIWRVERDASIDFAILGEPDHVVAELCEGRAPEAIVGLMYRDAAAPAGWRRTSERTFEGDLDALPFPKWDLLPHDRYVLPKSANAGRMRFLPMLTSRGCPYGCSYCPYPVGQGLKWRFRSPLNVVDEMAHLVRDLGVEYIIFRDPMFSLRQDRVVEICEEVLRRGIKVQWRCETRVDCLDENTIALMARAGCTGINFGVESTSPEIQKGVHRAPILPAEFTEKVALCKKHDIKTFAFFIVGLPGDTLDTIFDSMRFAVGMRADWTQFTVATPFVGTKLHDWAVRLGSVGADHYEIVSSHEGSIGNENLAAPQVHRLHKFAQFLQKNLINRRGILKNENRKNSAYRAAKRIADAVCHVLAMSLVALGEAYYRRAIPAGPPPQSANSPA